MVKVLFVCTGNICRSPTAEGVFRHRVREAGLADRIAADSAGTHGHHVGDPPDPRSVAAARRRGIDLSDLRARRLVPEDFRRFDHMLAMDRGHLALMRRMAPADGAADLRLFLDDAPAVSRREVPDPYYGEGTRFEEVLDLVEAGVDALLDRIRRTL